MVRVYTTRPVEDECAECSWQDIATELGSTRSTVERQGRRALRRLWREQVNPDIAARIARGRKPQVSPERIRQVLAAHGGNVQRTVRELGIARRTVRKYAGAVRIACLVACLVLAACTVPRPPGITDADERMVADCRYLGPVAGFANSRWNKETTVANGRATAATQALNMGATHVRWQGVTQSSFADVIVTGDAYRCP